MTKTFEETFDQLKQCIEDDGGIFDLGCGTKNFFTPL